MAEARAATDAAGGTDSVTRSTSRPRSVTDVAGGTDALTRALAEQRFTVDTAGGTDSASSSGSAHYTVHITDLANGSDSVSVVGPGRAPVLGSTLVTRVIISGQVGTVALVDGRNRTV